MRNWLKGILVATIALSATTLWAQTLVAADDADNPPYADNIWDLTDNGGFGFGNWYEISAGGGGRFIATAPFQVLEGLRSWGLFANVNGNYAIGRPLVGPRASGALTVLARHNVDNQVGFTGIAVYSGATEVIRFGLDPSSGNQAVFYQFGANSGSINLGVELRGAPLRYSLAWDSNGNFTLTVTNLGGPQVGSASGNWGSGVFVSAFGFLNFNSGSFQDLIFDKIEVVPEPASMLALGAGLAGLLALRRRRRA